TLHRLTQGSRGRQPWAGRRNPFRVGDPFAALPRVAADGNPGLDDATPSGLSTQHSALNTQYSVLSTQYSVLSTQYSVLSTQHSALSTQYSALSTQHSAFSTQHSALSTSSRNLLDHAILGSRVRPHPEKHRLTEVSSRCSR